MFAIVIFKISRPILGASPPSSTGAPPLDPAGGRKQTPALIPHPLIISKPTIGYKYCAADTDDIG